MKLFYRLFLLLAIFAFLCSAIFFAGVLFERTESTQPKESTQGFLLAESEGKVAVFRSGETEPLCVLEVYVSELPESDRRLLQSGIAVSNENELYALIEDYTG